MSPENDPSYRLYLERNFKAINDSIEGFNKLNNAHFDNVNDKLETIEKQSNRIESQTILTNSRVTHLESAALEVDPKIVKHQIECPQHNDIKVIKEDIQTIKNDLLEYTFFKKYPKAGLIIVGFALIMLGFGVYQVIENINANRAEKLRSEILRTINSNTE